MTGVGRESADVGDGRQRHHEVADPLEAKQEDSRR